ncbi:tyrosine-protein kinase Fer isoform X2 [Schistocerca gregaria]|uniref:tyrosine-protein kinase Fer isoform X2 n=1 Tax=Schistocerca gregaria TaxID=7010 RepID=UPI00211EAE1F|nr:tyrosine-protein kinase Fer isoform X2 [Schistocerca gregaria]
MGFSSAAVGGRVSAQHEALAARQEAELRLVDAMRRCLAAKARADRDYAAALQAAAAKADDLPADSLVAKAWRAMMEEMEAAAKTLRQNAEVVESQSLEALNNIYAEKRRARKQYMEDYNKIVSQFSQLMEEVSRKKTEYQKYLELYKLMRSRFEEHYVKAGRGGRKLDEVRDKFQKACRRLHATHNEYVLLLAAAAEAERALRHLLLPAAGRRARAAHLALLPAWRHALRAAAPAPAPALQAALDALDDAGREYDEFAADPARSPPQGPPTPTLSFDDSLVEDTSGKLLPNQLAVDNLTIESLRARLLELEAGVRDNQELQHHLTAQLPSEPAARELVEVQCVERRLQRQLEMIRGALSELGCEEVPSGCDLSLSVEAAFRPPPATNGAVATAADADGGALTPPEAPSTPTQGGERRTSESTFALVRQQLVQSALPGGRPLQEEEWFHGVLPRDEVVRLLTHEGDFLVRETVRHEESQVVLSVCWAGHHKHFIVQTTADGSFRFEGRAFPTVQELIQYQQQSQLPVTARSGAVLSRAVYRERWELNNDDVILVEQIGRGNFGDVHRGKLRKTGMEVAVKTCRMTVPEEHRRKFLQEGRILKQYNHPNIVRLIGICVQKQPIMIVMELVPGGSLLKFLRSHEDGLTQRQLLGMCRDTAAGMSYLESHNCIHRDLAARNCLIGQNNIVKISDFGMSREEEEYIVSDGMKQIPIKWTAPEALNFGKYTSLCDVWSYGILIWEIFSRGGVPYNGMSNSQAREKIDNGYRMPKPDGTPDEMYRLMLSCWEYKPEKRPHFDQILTVVETLYGAAR